MAKKKAKFSVGQVVKLNSGRPDMTVKAVFSAEEYDEEETEYRCQWFAGKKLETGDFPGSSLNLVQANPAEK